MRESPDAVSCFDRSVPAVIVKIGRYPLHHGGVGAIRTLGRVGVPVYAITEDRFTPAAFSRYLSGQVVWPTTGLEDEQHLLEGLVHVGHQLPRRAIAIPTDDEAAVLLAEHANDLAEWFVSPGVAPSLTRRLASKRGMHELCHQHGVPTPRASFPSSAEELVAFIDGALFPVVVKSVDPWERLRNPAVAHTTVVPAADDLLRLASTWPADPSVMLQEYIPRQEAEDWIFHAYCDKDSSCLVSFTGVKFRSWPPYAGVTTYARAMPNADLARQAATFCRQVGYRGVVDLDWRLDRRDGRFKLVDFNPRMGAQFRLFETEAGIDVIRALHLDLTGRPVPISHQRNGRRLIVENLDAPALFAYRGTGRPGFTRPHGRDSSLVRRSHSHEGVANAGVEAIRRLPSSFDLKSSKTELAWMAPDDPVPVLVMAARFARPAMARMIHWVMTRARHRGWHHPSRAS